MIFFNAQIFPVALCLAIDTSLISLDSIIYPNVPSPTFLMGSYSSYRHTPVNRRPDLLGLTLCDFSDLSSEFAFEGSGVMEDDGRLLISRCDRVVQR
jgi:hypothetical protein